MPRGRKKQVSESNHMDVDTESEDEELSVSQVSKSMRRVNVSQNARKGKAKARQLNSDSDEELQESRNTQRANGSQSQRGRARQIGSDSDEEPQPSTSQASQKKRKKNVPQSQRAHHLSQPSTSRAGDTLIGEEISASQISPNTSLTEQDFNHHVANTVKYILSADHSNTPIDKSRISKPIDCHNKRFRDVFKSAQDALKDVFGLEMVDIVEEKRDEQPRDAKQPKSTKFILVNTVNTEDKDKDVDEETSTRYLLLFICLTHIYMSGDKCTKESLRSFLKRLGMVTDNGARHEQFNDAMDTVEKRFVSERYIAYNSKEDEFTWGVRAIQELKPRAVMEFISNMYSGRSLDSWPQEYERLLAKEREQNQRPNGQVDDANQ